jgi:hypothetical protein
MMRSAKSAIAENYFAPLSSAASMARGKANGNGFLNHANSNQLISRTITGLKRWSIINRDLPVVSQVRAIHVYDFDNTCESSRSQLPLYFEAHIVQYS